MPNYHNQTDDQLSKEIRERRYGVDQKLPLVAPELFFDINKWDCIGPLAIEYGIETRAIRESYREPARAWWCQGIIEDEGYMLPITTEECSTVFRAIAICWLMIDDKKKEWLE